MLWPAKLQQQIRMAAVIFIVDYFCVGRLRERCGFTETVFRKYTVHFTSLRTCMSVIRDDPFFFTFMRIQNIHNSMSYSSVCTFYKENGKYLVYAWEVYIYVI